MKYSKRIVAPVVPDRTPTTEIHEHPCALCPSEHYPPDPEALDMLQWPREQQLAHVFPCAWRLDKLCKGHCDAIGTTTAELVQFHAAGGSLP